MRNREIQDIIEKEVPEIKTQLDNTANNNIKNSKRDLNLNSLKRNEPLFGFVDDDGNPAVLTKLVPLSEKYSIPFTCCMPSDFAEQGLGMNIEQLKTLQNVNGFEIASHGKSHIAINTSLSESKQLEEVYMSWLNLRKHGLDIDTIVYPYGQSTSYAREVASKYYKAGVTTNSFINTTPLKPYLLGRFNFPTDGWTLDTWKAKVDETITKNGVLLLMLHCGDAKHDATQQQILDDLISYIISLKGKDSICTVRDIVDRAGNFIDINEGELYYAKDGKNNLRELMYFPINPTTGIEQHTASSVPSDFPIQKASIDPIVNQNQPGLPVANRGTIFTINNGSTQSVQLLFARNNIFMRSTNADNSVWDGFAKIMLGVESTISVDFGTLNASERKQLTVNIAGFGQGQHIIVTPNKTMLGNIDFQYYNAGAGNIRLTFTNFRTDAQTLGVVDFKVIRNLV